MVFILFFMIVMCPLTALLFFFIAEARTAGPFQPESRCDDGPDEC